MKLKAAVVGLAALGGVLLAGPASAIPNGLPDGARTVAPKVNAEQVRLVCDPWGRCWWRRPVWRGAAVWGPRRVWGPRWRGAYAWGPRPVWGPRPWGPRPWGWHRRW